MAKRTSNAADAEDEAAAIRYAATRDPRFIVCRAERRHRPHMEIINGRYVYKDIRPDPTYAGGLIVETWCEICDQAMIRKLTADYYVRGGWQVLYDKGEEGYLAPPGEGLSLVSKAGSAALRRMQFEGVPELPKAAKGRGKR